MAATDGPRYERPYYRDRYYDGGSRYHTVYYERGPEYYVGGYERPLYRTGYDGGCYGDCGYRHHYHMSCYDYAKPRPRRRYRRSSFSPSRRRSLRSRS